MELPCVEDFLELLSRNRDWSKRIEKLDNFSSQRSHAFVRNLQFRDKQVELQYSFDEGVRLIWHFGGVDNLTRGLRDASAQKGTRGGLVGYFMRPGFGESTITTQPVLVS